MKNKNAKAQSLFSLTKQDLVSKILNLQNSMTKLQNEMLKTQIIAATRLDVIRLLGFIMNRDPSPDPMLASPAVPEVKKIMASELVDLAAHLRIRADEFEKVSKRLLSEVENKEDTDKQVKE